MPKITNQIKNSHILIVEDEARMAATLEKGLIAADFDVTIVSTGHEANTVDISGYDLVLLDWMLPGFSGLDLLRNWRRKNITTPIIMLTAKNGVNDVVDAFSFGADDFVNKIFEWPELIARIKNQIKRKGELTPKTSKGLKLDLEGHQFYDDGEAVDLSLREFDILKFIFDHPNKVNSRTDIIRAVYKDNTDPMSNVCERHIRSIRTKFKNDPIKTVHGLGYKLRVK
jgi:DNA-binding response OmpR family regulator